MPNYCRTGQPDFNFGGGGGVHSINIGKMQCVAGWTFAATVNSSAACFKLVLLLLSDNWQCLWDVPGYLLETDDDEDDDEEDEGGEELTNTEDSLLHSGQ